MPLTAPPFTALVFCIRVLLDGDPCQLCIAPDDCQAFCDVVHVTREDFIAFEYDLRRPFYARFEEHHLFSIFMHIDDSFGVYLADTTFKSTFKQRIPIEIVGVSVAL